MSMAKKTTAEAARTTARTTAARSAQTTATQPKAKARRSRNGEDTTLQVCFRVPARWVERARVVARRRSEGAPPWSLNDALRLALLRGLDRIDEDEVERRLDREDEVERIDREVERRLDRVDEEDKSKPRSQL